MRFVPLLAAAIARAAAQDGWTRKTAARSSINRARREAAAERGTVAAPELRTEQELADAAAVADAAAKIAEPEAPKRIGDKLRDAWGVDCGHPCPAPGSRGPSKNVHGWRKWKDLVHYHIAKNAGTTLRSVITKRYGGMELHGPEKKAYGSYFRSGERKWRGRYFVTMAREPTSKLLSQFFYVRSTLGGDFGTWHRCVTFEERRGRAE